MPTRPPTPVRVTANFEANLAAVEAYWVAQGAPEAHAQLLDELADTVVANLEAYPSLGRPFLARRARSLEAIEAARRLQDRLGAGELREYLSGDYLILYAVIQETVYLLAIKHHKQLSFDLARLWPPRDEG